MMRSILEGRLLSLGGDMSGTEEQGARKLSLREENAAVPVKR